ncbi:CsbD family protein [Sulfitobacter sp. S0837]|uniref:CsbD family protein n=1 Tax=Sulfitobacter maritimus TaxID=2741719 RepID=UPI001582328F|nr:CsbD family protein [Sulfitobacter maritimus]NUH65827.1 CsbD family protein [Sulfitobacter maritimus]
MNWDRIEGNWKQMTGAAKAQWGDLTDDEITETRGNREKLVGKVQERYGIEKDEAERQVDEFASKY